MTKTFDVSEEERQRIYQENWDKGNGFRFMFGTFCDITYDRAANDAACDFIKGKIKEIVKDPETARKLLPTEIYARRPVRILAITWSLQEIVTKLIRSALRRRLLQDF